MISRPRLQEVLRYLPVAIVMYLLSRVLFDFLRLRVRITP